MNGSVVKRTASFLIAFLLLLYVGYQVYRYHHSSVKTEQVSYFTASNSVETSVVALRHEIVLKSGMKGAADYVANSGGKISKGSVIAHIYSDESQISAHHQVQETDQAIAQLQSLQLPGSTYSFGADNANKRIWLKLMDMLTDMRSGDSEKVYDEKNTLLNLINERQIGTGQVKNFNVRIASLKALRQSLASAAGNPIGSVTSPEAGYFIQSTDGLENAYDISKVRSITCSDIRKLQKLEPSPIQGTIGKISRDFEWYVVCILKPDQLTGFKQLDPDDTVSIRFPFVSSSPVQATVAAVNQPDQNSEGAVALRCEGMDSALAEIRSGIAEISLKKYTGLKVSQQAIHYKKMTKKVENSSGKKVSETKDVEGVYVLRANQLNFRQIIPEFSTSSYVICNPLPDEGSLLTDSTVKPYDQVVTEGTDLYDGKVIS